MRTRIGRSVSGLLLAIAVAAIPGVAAGDTGWVPTDSVDYGRYVVVITGRATTPATICGVDVTVYSAVFTPAASKTSGGHTGPAFVGEIGLLNPNVKPGTRYDIGYQSACDPFDTEIELSPSQPG